MGQFRLSKAGWITVVEGVLAVMFSTGVGLVVGAVSSTAGIGAGLLALSVIAFFFVVAYERGG